MVTIQVRYHNILRRITGVERETLTMPEGTLITALESLADQHSPRMHTMLFAPDGNISSHLVIFINERLVPPDQRDLMLCDGDELMLFPAISGGSLTLKCGE